MVYVQICHLTVKVGSISNPFNFHQKRLRYEYLNEGDGKVEAITYFTFKNSIEALEFYEKYLGATDIKRVPGDHEMFQEADEDKRLPEDFTMNASFKILGKTFMCSDVQGDEDINNSGVNIAFQFKYEDEADRQAAEAFFNKAIEGGCEASMPLGRIPWSPLYGMFEDPFGITWMINAYQ